MKKKFYIQPQINNVLRTNESIMQSLTGSVRGTVSGTQQAPLVGDAPTRRINIMYI